MRQMAAAQRAQSAAAAEESYSASDPIYNSSDSAAHFDRFALDLSTAPTHQTRSQIWKSRFKEDPFMYLGLAGVFICFTTAFSMHLKNRSPVIQNYLLFGRVGSQGVALVATLNFGYKRQIRREAAINHNREAQFWREHPELTPPPDFDLNYRNHRCD